MEILDRLPQTTGGSLRALIGSLLGRRDSDVARSRNKGPGPQWCDAGVVALEAMFAVVDVADCGPSFLTISFQTCEETR